MHCATSVCVVSLFVLTALSSKHKRTADLDSVVQQYRDVIKRTHGENDAPVEVQADLIPRPSGYKNSNNWTTTSALHLLHLLKDSDTSGAVYRALQFKLATGSSESAEAELRGTNNKPKEDIILRIKHYAAAKLPSASIGIKTLLYMKVTTLRKTLNFQ